MKKHHKILTIGILFIICILNACEKCVPPTINNVTWKLVKITTPTKTVSNFSYTEILKEDFDTLNNTSSTTAKSYYSLTYRNGVLVEKHEILDGSTNCKENSISANYRDGLQRKFWSLAGSPKRTMSATGYVNSIGSSADTATYYYEALY